MTSIGIVMLIILTIITNINAIKPRRSIVESNLRDSISRPIRENKKELRISSTSPQGSYIAF